MITITNRGLKMTNKKAGFYFMLREVMDSAFYTWIHSRKHTNRFLEIEEDTIDIFEHMNELERKFNKVYE